MRTDNFGKLSERYAPELLDHLAKRFVTLGWSIKRTIEDDAFCRLSAGESRQARDREREADR